jgi:hypothetical protein
MIAPIRPSQPSSSHLTDARRAVGALFLKNDSRAAESRQELSRRATWLLLGWAAIVAIAYLIRGRS